MTYLLAIVLGWVACSVVCFAAFLLLLRHEARQQQRHRDRFTSGDWMRPHSHSCRCDGCWSEAMSEQESQR